MAGSTEFGYLARSGKFLSKCFGFPFLLYNYGSLRKYVKTILTTEIVLP